MNRIVAAIVFAGTLLVYATCEEAGAKDFVILGDVPNDFGERVEIAAAKIGVDVKFASKECGPPRWSEGTCVWEVSPRIDLTTNDFHVNGRYQFVMAQWHYGDQRLPGEDAIFRSLCTSLVAALLPDAPATKISALASKLAGNLRGEGEATGSGIQFYRNAYPGITSCDAHPKID
jgi:hypothetical protein